ncbi:LLM class flavin-dependent oxidoreductase [Streptomyces sp. URMC 125]|uniref:LLM class flavin-dependent oxidoreductase n=1 Tax=Streptomyces sp. URMC 125 TaxID=3423419 RepID=UPI003F198317
MRLGIQVFASRRAGEDTRTVLSRLTEQVRLAESTGYEVAWLAEHHGTDWNLCTDPLTLAGYLAANTNTIRLGTAVVNLGLHHPVEVAERAGMVNALSGGRLELGIGKGFAPQDYRSYGLAPGESETRFLDHYDRLVDKLAGSADSASIPVWLATTGSGTTLDLAARHGHGILLATHGEKLVRTLHTARERRPDIPVGLTRAVHIGPSPDAAWSHLTPYLSWYRDRLSRLRPGATAPALEELRETFCVLGRGADCAQQAKELQVLLKLSDFTAVLGIAGMPNSEFERAAASLAAAWRTAFAEGAASKHEDSGEADHALRHPSGRRSTESTSSADGGRTEHVPARGRPCSSRPGTGGERLP